MTNSSTRLLKNSRAAVTLVELLVVVGLLAFLAGTSVYVYRGAQQDARIARTRGTITKLNDVILSQWEEYRYRAVDLRMDSARHAALGPIEVAPLDSRAQAHLRMLVLRDTMRMEMPDRVSDLLFAPSQYVVPENMSMAGAFLSDRAFPHKFGLLHEALRNAMANSEHAGLLGQPGGTPPDYPNFPRLSTVGYVSTSTGTDQPSVLFAGNLLDWTRAVQSSELLYMIVANSTYGGTSALEYFRPSEIGDPDGDDLLEFIDAWGRPISWIRWPAGFDSDLNRYAGTDAMDPLRTDWRYRKDVGSPWPEPTQPQTIVPLVVSAGADQQFGLIFDHADFYVPGESLSIQSEPICYAKILQGYGVSSRSYIDPFFTWDYANDRPNGQASARPFDETQMINGYRIGYRANQLGAAPNFMIDGSENTFAADNITNHDIILGQ